MPKVIKLNTKAQIDIAAGFMTDPEPGDKITFAENLLNISKEKLDGIWALFEEHARKIRCKVAVKYSPIQQSYTYEFTPA